MPPDPASPDGPRVDLDPDVLNQSEERIEATFLDDAGSEVRLMDAATALLVWTLVAVQPRTATAVLDENDELRYSADADALILSANVFIGARAVRVIRAARAVLARGFEGEARALDRILVELQAHRRSILEDPSGGEALAWLRRQRTRGITKRVAAMEDAELYGNLCTDSHGDPAPVLRLRDADANEIELAPQRTPATRASLLMHAGFARDQAMLISKLSGESVIKGIDELDAEIHAAWDRLNSES